MAEIKNDIVDSLEEHQDNPIMDGKAVEKVKKKKKKQDKNHREGQDGKKKRRKKKKKNEHQDGKHGGTSANLQSNTGPEQQYHSESSSWDSESSDEEKQLWAGGETKDRQDDGGSIDGFDQQEEAKMPALDEEEQEEIFWAQETHRKGKLLFFIPIPLTARFLGMLNYFLLLIIFLLYVYTGRSTESYFMRQALEDQFITGEYARGYSFSTITNQVHFFDWVQNLFIPNMYPNTFSGIPADQSINQTNFNATSNQTSSPTLSPTMTPTTTESIGESKQIFNDIGYRMGGVRLRQLRVRNDTCSVPKKFEDSLQRCYPSFKESKEDQTSFQGILWKSWVKTGLTPDAYGQEYKYSYPGSGYVITLPEEHGLTSQLFQDLYESTWLDYATRAVILEFNIYNPNIDLVANCVLITEFSASGSLATSSRIRPVPLLKPLRFSDGESTGEEKLSFGLEITMYSLVFFRLISLAIDIRRMTLWRYLYPMFNKLTLLMYLCFILMACFRLTATSMMEVYKDRLASRKYLPFGAAAEMNQLVDDIAAFIAIFLFILAFDHFKFNHGLNQFTLTVMKSFSDMFAVLLIIGVLLGGFGLAFMLEFGHGAASYRDYVESITTLFETTLGVFDLEEIRYVNREMGPFLFILFIIMMIFIVLSMLFAIVNMAYAETRAMYALHDTGRIDDPVFNDFCRIYDYIVDILHEKFPKTQKYIMTYEVMSEKVMGKRESVQDLVKGRRAIKALKRQLSEEENDPALQQSMPKYDHTQDLHRRLTRGSSMGLGESLRQMDVSGTTTAQLRQTIAEMEARMTGVMPVPPPMHGPNQEEGSTERSRSVSRHPVPNGEYKKTLMKELLFLEKQQRSMMRKIEKLTKMARRDAQEAAVRRGCGKPPTSPDTPYESPPKRSEKKRHKSSKKKNMAESFNDL